MLEWYYVGKVHENKITPKRDIQTIFIVNESTIYQKEIPKRPPNLAFQKPVNISISELCQFPIHQNWIEIVHWNDVDPSSTKVTSIKYSKMPSIFHSSKLCRRKYIEITSIFCPRCYVEKVSRKDVHFSPIKITSKNYAEATWIIVDILFSMYHRNIDIESTSIRRVVSFWKFLSIIYFQF